MDELPVTEERIERRPMPKACDYCGDVPDIKHRHLAAGTTIHFMVHNCTGPGQKTTNDAILDWNSSRGGSA